VPPTAQLDVADRGLAAHRVRMDVMELEEPTLGAPAAAGADERAMPEVSQEDRALDLGRDVTRPRGRPAGRARRVGGGELLPRELRQQRGESAVQNGRFVAGGNRVAQHVPGEPQLLESFDADRELEPVAIR
jgi:hypothetical protein